MSLADNINNNIKEAMKAKDQAALRSLRAIKSAILMAQTEKGGNKELDETQEIQLLQKLVKSRRDSLEIFKNQGRDDLAAKEEEEIEVIERFLPKQMSDEEVEQVIATIISETGAEGMKDMGKVMGLASKQLAGKADNKKISELVKAKLG